MNNTNPAIGNTAAPTEVDAPRMLTMMEVDKEWRDTGNHEKVFHIYQDFATRVQRKFCKVNGLTLGSPA